MSSSPAVGASSSMHLSVAHDTDLLDKSVPSRSSGRIKSPGVLKHLMFHLGLMSKRRVRSYNRVTLAYNEYKLEKASHRIVKVVIRDGGRGVRAGKIVKAVGSKMRKCDLRMEDYQRFSKSRGKGVVIEKHGGTHLFVEKAFYRAITHSLRGHDQGAQDKVMDFFAGARGDAQSQGAAQLRGMNLVTSSAGVEKPDRQAMSWTIVDVFKMVREDQALMRKLTDANLNVETLAFVGKHISGDRDTAIRMSDQFAPTEAKAVRPDAGIGGKPASATATELSIGRVVDGLSSDERSRLVQKIEALTEHVEKLLANEGPNAPLDGERLQEAMHVKVALTSINDVVSAQVEDARAALGRYTVESRDTDFSRLEAIYVKTAKGKSIEKVVRECIASCGNYQHETLAERQAYYLDLAKHVNKEYQHAAIRDGRGASSHDMTGPVYKDLLDADKAVWNREIQRAGPSTATSASTLAPFVPVPIVHEVEAPDVTGRGIGDAAAPLGPDGNEAAEGSAGQDWDDGEWEAKQDPALEVIYDSVPLTDEWLPPPPAWVKDRASASVPARARASSTPVPPHQNLSLRMRG